MTVESPPPLFFLSHGHVFGLSTLSIGLITKEVKCDQMASVTRGGNLPWKCCSWFRLFIDNITGKKTHSFRETGVLLKNLSGRVDVDKTSTCSRSNYSIRKNPFVYTPMICLMPCLYALY